MFKKKYAIIDCGDYDLRLYTEYFYSYDKACRLFCQYYRRKSAGECFNYVRLVNVRTGKVYLEIR